jgi:hypothetical protein
VRAGVEWKLARQHAAWLILARWIYAAEHDR